MSEPNEQEKDAAKQRIRTALDTLQRFVGDDGKLNATMLTRALRDAEAERDAARARVAELEAENARLRKRQAGVLHCDGEYMPELSFKDWQK